MSLDDGVSDIAPIDAAMVFAAANAAEAIDSLLSLLILEWVLSSDRGTPAMMDDEAEEDLEEVKEEGLVFEK